MFQPMTCLIIVFSITRGTLTLVLFCLGFLQVHCWQWKHGGRYSYGTKYICIISKQQRLSQARDIREIVCVNNEQKRPKDGSLWHATWNFPIVRLKGPNLDKLSPILKITFDPRQSCVPNCVSRVCGTIFYN